MSVTLKQVIIKTIVEALVENGLNQSKAAKQLAVSRGTVRSYLAEYTNSTLTTKNLSKNALNKYLKENGTPAATVAQYRCI